TESAGPMTESTSETTTTDPTTTTETTTTAEPTTETMDPTTTTEMCPMSECTPGEVFVGEECGECGNQQRVCNDDCQWGSFECVDGSELCDIWMLRGDLSTWEGKRIGADGGDFHSPKEYIRGAFDVESLELGYVFTDTSYHILDLGNLEWIDSGPRDELFPELDGKEMYAAYNVHDLTDPPTTDVLTISTPENAHNYTYNLNTQAITYADTVLCCNWEPPELSPLESNVRAAWLSLDDYPWEILPDTDICDGEPIVESLPRHGAVIGAGKVHIQDVGFCFEFVEKHNFSEFEPFALPGAPPSAEVVGAAFWLDGLYVFRENLQD
ncbi:MAG: hypothetical protein ACPG4T_22115, partial [Nannocystaceae bacterium]